MARADGSIRRRERGPARLMPRAGTKPKRSPPHVGCSARAGIRPGVLGAGGGGVARGGGIAIGLLPDADPSLANPHVSVIIATGIGEARNALITRAALCLVAIGNSFGTLSEVAFGRQFGKLVIGLEGAASVDGVRHVTCPTDALELVARVALQKL
jgi:uncharacterized protein (TIGR00725 family)